MPGEVECPALGGRFAISDGATTQGEVWLAIRAEHVALRQPTEPPRAQEARLTGTYEAMLDLGEAAMLHFRADTGALLEVRCGSRVLRRFGLKAGDAGVVGLPAGDLFTLPR